MSDCLFCKIIAGDIPSEQVYEDDHMLVFKDISPKAPVHLLAIPKLHISSLNAAEPEHKELLGQILLTLPEIAKQQGLNDGYRTILNTEKGGGQVVFHLHFHLLGGGPMPFE